MNLDVNPMLEWAQASERMETGWSAHSRGRAGNKSEAQRETSTPATLAETANEPSRDGWKLGGRPLPVLVQETQDKHSVTLYRVHQFIRQRRYHEFASTFNRTLAATARQLFQ